jgi:cellulose biosynthesis protein BcsQ
MHVVTVANQKGGTGKTTLAIHLASWLAQAGRPVVLVDLDTQGSVARFLGLDKVDDVAELLSATLILRADRRPSLSSFLCPVPGYQNLVVIRGWERSAELDRDLGRPDVRPAGEVLADALAPLRELPSLLVVIDTGPYAGLLQEAALSIADHVIVPGKPEAASEDGILDIARRLKAAGRGITAVVPTLWVAAAKEHRATIEDWRRTLGPAVYYDPKSRLWGLPRRVIWGEIVRYGRPIWDLAPNDVAAHEMKAVLERVAYDAKI